MTAPIHARFRRIEVSLAAANLGLQFAGDATLLRELQAVHDRVSASAADLRSSFGRQVADALRTPAGPARSSDEVKVLVRALAFLAPRAGLGLLPPQQPGDELPQTTLAGALADAGEPSEVIASLTRPPLEVTITTPSHRSHPSLAAPAAVRLAQRVAEVLPTREPAGLRTGLEAHFLFAVASRLQVPAMRYQFAEFGPPWARLLLTLSAAFEARAGTCRWRSTWPRGPGPPPCSSRRSRSWSARWPTWPGTVSLATDS